MRRNLGAAGREQVQRQHLPDHYARAVFRAVLGSGRDTTTNG
jgi:hypothetical protein